jgi:translocation and assembly module TamB
MRRVLKWVAIGFVGLALLIVVVINFVAQTDFGHEQIRKRVVDALDSKTKGRKARIGRIEGNLLEGITLHDVWIGDEKGNVFISVDEAKTKYGMRYLFRKKVVLTDMTLVHPIIVLDKPPGGDWNFEKLFKDTTTKTTPEDTTLGFGDWIRFERVEIINGQLLVRRPWSPNDTLKESAKDSVIALALAGGSRTKVVDRGVGLQQVVELKAMNAYAPLILLKDPNEEAMRIEIARLSMVAAPFNPPVAEVRDLAGDFRIDDDSLWFAGLKAQLPGSLIRGSGSLVFKGADMTLRLRGEPVALADLRWLYPRLPSEGSGSLDFALTWREDFETYLARNVQLRVGASHVAGDFGITVGDTFALHDTDLEFQQLDTRLIEQLVPGLDLPRRGTLGGRAELAGGSSALRVNTDIAFHDQQTGTSRLGARGQIGFHGGFSARDLNLQLSGVQLELLKAFKPDMPVFGTLTGTATVNGSTRTSLVTTADLVHDADGVASPRRDTTRSWWERRDRSRIVGTGEFSFARGMFINIDANADPIALATVGRFVPALGLRGSATGPIVIRGTMGNLRVETTLGTSDGGTLAVTGNFDLESEQKGYDVAAAAKLFNVRRVMEKGPRTSLTATATVRGRGFDPATMRADIAADVQTSAFDSIGVDSATVRLAIADGVAHVDSLSLRAPFGTADVAGSFGLTSLRTGQLSYKVSIDSLRALERYLPSDSGVVTPRPRRVARAMERARRDSAALAEATAVEREVMGTPGPTLVVDTPTVVPKDSLTGSMYLAGTLDGTISDFDLRGRGALENLAVGGNTLKRGQVEYGWINARTDHSSILLGARLDSASAAGFQLDSVEARIAYGAPKGEVDILIHQHEDQYYRMRSTFEVHQNHNELHLADVNLQIDTVSWIAPHPSSIQWGPAGIMIQNVELRSAPYGRIYVDGLLPTKGTANVTVAVDNFEIAHALALLQSDIDLSGLVTLSANLQGTRENPRFEGAFGHVNGKWDGTAIPDISATVAYDNRVLTMSARAARVGGKPMLTAEGKIPINLALSGVTGSRLLDEPISVDIVADSLPVDLISRVTDAVANVAGSAVGNVAIRGTTRHPRMAGALALNEGRMRIVPLGVNVRRMNGFVRMQGDSIYVDSLVGSTGGPIRIAGTIGVADFSKPSFGLKLNMRNAKVLDNEMGTLKADAQISMDGPFSAPYVTGNLRIREGVYYLPKSDNKSVIGADDPALFNVIDTSLVAQREVFPAQSPLLSNLRMDVSVQVDRDTWVRSHEANVEVYSDGELAVHVDRAAKALTLTGALSTDRGQYTFLSRRFEIKRGSATFIGGPELNPTLQITGESEVRLPGKEAFQIRVLIGGTVERPRLTLESDAQPPLSQSDLLSYLAFGESSSTLLQGGSSLSGPSGASGGTPVGAVGALAIRKLAGVAMGVMVDELEGETARKAQLDVFNITPADIPTEVSTQQTTGLLKGTEIEMGKYFQDNFVAVQKPLDFGTNPGILFQRRTGKGFMIESTLQTRYRVRQPTLSENRPVSSTSVLGLFLVREWRF